ncbi:MAG: hypothetical protein JKY89_06110, partial [Immundisolibacteraceae bacterium]|nr:hypothetical protein [Immundisolibacteraceae bacterium]
KRQELLRTKETRRSELVQSTEETSELEPAQSTEEDVTFLLMIAAGIDNDFSDDEISLILDIASDLFELSKEEFKEKHLDALIEDLKLIRRHEETYKNLYINHVKSIKKTLNPNQIKPLRGALENLLNIDNNLQDCEQELLDIFDEEFGLNKKANELEPLQSTDEENIKTNKPTKGTIGEIKDGLILLLFIFLSVMFFFALGYFEVL